MNHIILDCPEPGKVGVLLTKDQICIVDADDWDFLSQWRWCASRSDTGYYAMRGESRKGVQTFFYMHRVITGAQKGQVVDHIDRNKLNNSRSNLRLVTVGQNSMNTSPHRDSVSKFKGVSLNKKGGKPWMAQISLNRKHKTLGFYETEQEAAAAYDNAALELFGNHAFLNKELNHD